MKKLSGLKKLFKLGKQDKFSIILLLPQTFTFKKTKHNELTIEFVLNSCLTDKEFLLSFNKHIQFHPTHIKIQNKETSLYYQFQNWYPNLESFWIYKSNQVLITRGLKNDWTLSFPELKIELLSNDKHHLFNFLTVFHSPPPTDKDNPILVFFNILFSFEKILNLKEVKNTNNTPYQSFLNKILLDLYNSSKFNSPNLKSFTMRDLENRRSHPSEKIVNISLNDISKILDNMSDHAYASAGGYYTEKFHLIHQSSLYEYTNQKELKKLLTLSSEEYDKIRKNLYTVKKSKNSCILLLSKDLTPLIRRYGLLSSRLSLLNTGVMIHHLQLIANKYNIIVTPFGAHPPKSDFMEKVLDKNLSPIIYFVLSQNEKGSTEGSI